MNTLPRALRFALVSCAAIAASADQAEKQKTTPGIDPDLYSQMKWRSIGPSRGGRSVAVAGVPGRPLVYYMGGTGGGVWKTVDAGWTWQPIGDKFLKTGSVGAIAVADADPNVVYVGMGESCVRGNFSHGDGVYKSYDAGKTWEHIGLSDSRQIGRVRVHPKNPDLVYVAALGHIFGPNKERGVFRSRDGGKTWENVLFVDENTGAVDLALDPTNPRMLYAAFWQVSRTPYSLESGGEGSGLYKSTDGGDTWNELTKGLPEGLKGRIGVAVSPVKPDRVWAIVEAQDGGIFRSEDGGESWRRVNEDRRWRQRAWYYTHIYADTQSADTVYVLNTALAKSTDGGKSFSSIRVPHGDNHDLWIAPENNQRMVNANDGGANVTFNGGASWSRQDNQPTAQFYHVTTDNQFPYRVYGAQQDSSTASISSRNRPGNWQRDFFSVGGGESGYIAVRPDNPAVIYAGSYGGFMTRYDHRTRQTRNISVWPENPMGGGADLLKYRFQWTFPIVISPHDPNTLYAAGNVLFRSTNEGQSWEPISPDLTTNDKSKQGPSGGPITHDNTSVEYYCTIFALAESPHEKGVIWAGSDDGLVHITRDGGLTWKDVTPLNSPKWALISQIDVSPHDPATCYIAVNAYKLDDFKPYIFKTADYGSSWDLIVDGIARDAFVRAVREDPQRVGLLYAGTETGVVASFDDGKNWQSLQLDLPVSPITDLVVKENDLVVATQGRSFWILDDLTHLHQLNDELASAKAHLFKPRRIYKSVDRGVILNYRLAEKPESIKLELLDSDGELIKSFEPRPAGEEADEAPPRRARFGFVSSKHIPADKGMNTFVWDTRYPDAVEVKGAVMWGGSTRGPAAPPGRYHARLTVNGEPRTQTFEIAIDPRVPTTQKEFDQRFALLIRIRDRVSDAHEAINRIRSIKAQTVGALRRVKEYREISVTDEQVAERPREAGAAAGLETAGGSEIIVASHTDYTAEDTENPVAALEQAVKDLKEKLTAIEEELIQTRSKSNQDPLNYPIKLNNKIAALAGVVSRGNFGPTDQVYGVFVDLSAKLDGQLSALQGIIEIDVSAFNKLVQKEGIPAVIVKP